MILSPACGSGKHSKCTGAFEAKERGEKMVVFCSCTCHMKVKAVV